MTALSSTAPYFGTFLLASLPLFAPAAAIAQPELWVDPAGGSDRIGNGRPALPVKTISRALELAGPNTIIHLEAGTYTGEDFPLVLPPTVSLQGSPRDRSSSVTIRGGGHFDAAAAGVDAGSNGRQHVAIVATGAGSIRNLTIANPGGIGVWVLGNGNVTVSDNTFLDSREAGLAIAAAGAPSVRNNTFSNHPNRALSLDSSTGAEVITNTFERNGTGIWVGGVAVPRLQDNRLQGNRIGIAIDGITRPVLRGNQIENSLAAGIEVKSRTRPDLGSAIAPGNNVVRGSATPILGLDTATVIAAGNRLSTSPVPPSPTAAATEIPPAPVPIAPAAAATPRRPRDRRPTSTEKFHPPAPRPAASRPSSARQDGAIIIPVPPPSTVTTTATAAPPPPQVSQQTKEQSAPPRSATGSVAIVPVPATPAPSRTAGAVRVLVEAASFVERERVVALVPEAIASSYQGRSVMQVGVFASQENVAEIRQRLERFGFSVLVVPR